MDTGTIVVTRSSVPRYGTFYDCMQGLAVPPGWKIVRLTGAYLPQVRNLAVEKALEINPDGKWLQYWDDDHVFDPGILKRLLERDLDIVVPLYCQRHPPFGPHAYRWTGEGYRTRPIPLAEYPAGGLMEVDGAGLGGALVKMSVFHKIKKPWFATPITPGETQLVGEDFYFFKQAQRVGFKIHVDLDNPIGHCWHGSARLVHRAGRWMTVLSELDTQQDIIMFPTVEREFL